MGNTKYFLYFYLIEWVLPTIDIVIVFLFLTGYPGLI